MEQTPEQVFNSIKPLLVGLLYEILRQAGVGNGEGGLAVHDLNGPYHTGSLDIAKVPDALAVDGSRPLVGSLPVNDGLTIDGRDISADGTTLDATVANVTAVSNALVSHAGANAVAAHGSVGAHAHSDAASGGDLTQYATVANTRPAHTANHLGSPALADSYAWSNTHNFSNEVTFNGSVELNGPTTVDDVTILGNLTPATTDSSLLGSATKLWNKAYISEIEATLLAQNTAFAVGGWVILSKNEGTLAAEVLAAHTTIDFGQSMTTGDFVLMRAFNQVEYLSIGSLVSGYRYNVTRSLDPSGANDWPQGTVYMVLGQNGNGRIELNANDTPRISLMIQGATYNAYKEMIRIGDLNGNWGYGVAKQGVAIGSYEPGKNNITIDEDGTFKIRRFNIDILRFTNSDAYIENPLTLGTNGRLTFGGARGWLDANGVTLRGDGNEGSNYVRWRRNTLTGPILMEAGVKDTVDGNLGILNVNADLGYGTLALSASGGVKEASMYLASGSTSSVSFFLDGAPALSFRANKYNFGASSVAQGGTTFPSSPANNDRFYRTDRRIEYFWNSDISRWLSVQNFPAPLVDVRALSGYTVGSYFTTAAEAVAAIFDINCRLYNVYITSNLFVGVGATNDATRYWQYRLEVSKNETGGAVNLIAAANTSLLPINGTDDLAGTATEFTANAKGGRVLLYLRPFGTTPTPISARPSIWYRWVG